MHNALAVIGVLLFAMLSDAFASEAISMTELAILDKNGAPAKDLNPGDRLVIQSSLQNNNQLEQEFVYMVQVQDSAGYTVFLSWKSGAFQDNQTLDIA